MDAESKALFDTLKGLRVEVADALQAYERVASLGPGDADYEAIKAEHGGDDEKTKAEVKTLAAMHSERVDELQEEEAETIDELRDRGVDVDSEMNALLRAKVQRCEKDPAEQKLRQEVDAILDQIRPVTRVDGEVSMRCQLGADGHLMTPDDKLEMASVEVLDASEPLGAEDREPDVMHVHTEEEDWCDAAKGQKIDTGARWFEGKYRMNPLLAVMLKPYQLECLRFLLERLAGNEGALVAHAMGLGKSLTVLASLEVYGTADEATLRAVVACPKSVVTNWADEIHKWQAVNDCISLDAHPVVCVDKEATNTLRLWLKHGGALIVGHDQFRRLVQSGALPITPETVVVVDEAHMVKTPGTHMYDLIDSLPTRRRIFMSGTPMQNNLKEYFSMVQLLQPGLLGDTVGHFNQLYGHAIDKGMQKDSTDAEVATSERTVQIMRWKAAAVMHDKSAAVLLKELDEKREYRLLHACSQPVPTDSSWIKERHNVHEAARGDKVALTISLIDAIRAQAPGDRIVVFSTRNDTLKLVCQMRFGGMYTGAVDRTAQRDQLVEDFRATANGVLYVATRAGGVGINLSCANRVIVMDASWNPGDDAQAVSRCYRMGQTKPVYVYRLIAESTLEEGIYRMNVKKQNLTSRVLDEQEALRIYSRDEVMQFAASVEDQEALDAGALAEQDPCLLSLLSDGWGIRVTSHDELFSQDSAKELTLHEQCEALNDMHAKAPRVLMMTDDDGDLVAPATLFFESSRDGKTFTQTVDFSQGGSMYVTLSPAVPQGTTSEGVLYQIVAKPVVDLAAFLEANGEDKEAENDEDWTLVAMHDVDLAPKETVLRISLDPLLEEGYYVLRSRLATASGKCGLWSAPSAPVYLV